MSVISTLPDEVDWQIVQGDDLSFTLQLNATNPDGTPGAPLDLSGLTVRAEVRVQAAQSTPTGVFVCTLLPQVAPTKGQVSLHLAGADTFKLPPGVDCPYDVQTSSATETHTRLRGTITTTPESTRG